MNGPLRARRLPFADQLEREGEWLVLVEDRAVRVTGLAPTILQLTEDWCSLDRLVEGLEEAYGAAPDGAAEALVRQALTELAAEGLVEVARD